MPFALLRSKIRTIMKAILHRAGERGYAHHGWLETHHTFSFAGWYDPRRMNFGALRVLNDDTVAGGEGFGAHPHEDMEIVSIPLEGQLRHGDSMGNSSVLSVGQIQVMSAGTGVVHSEYNNLTDRPVRFLQIWIFPDRRGHKPRYEDITIGTNTQGELHTIVTPEDAREAGAGWVHQQAWFHLLDLGAGQSLDYAFRGEGHGLYVFVLEGSAVVADHELERRDGIALWETSAVRIAAGPKTGSDSKATSGTHRADISAARLLLIEVPV